ncbi:MAG: hypothetical protein Rhims3KO_22520 [Hyphomicrobiales bacterium]
MSFDIIPILAVLIGLQAKHFLFDFVFQSDWQVRNKGLYGHPGGLVHSGMHALGTLVVMGLATLFGTITMVAALALAAADFLIHYHIDWVKSKLSQRLQLTPDRQGFWIALGADQAAHQLTNLGLMTAYFLL